MAMDWYYVANQQQAGPVELATLQQMLRTGALSSGEMVFGPGMSQWAPANQVPTLHGGGGAAAAAHGGASALGYQGTDTGTSGISPNAMEMLRQTKPWTRFASIMMFIGAGLMVLGSLIFMGMAMAMSSSRLGAFPMVAGVLYIGFGALCFIPALFLTRFSNGVADLLRTNRSSDLERALEAQKSYWKFVGIFTIVVICIYILIAIFAVAMGSRF